MDANTSHTTSWDAILPLHERNEKDESPWGLKIGQRCNVRSQGPMNEEGPT